MKMNFKTNHHCKKISIFNKNENLFTLPTTMTERLQRDGTIKTTRTLTNGDANGDKRKGLELIPTIREGGETEMAKTQRQ